MLRRIKKPSEKPSETDQQPQINIITAEMGSNFDVLRILPENFSAKCPYCHTQQVAFDIRGYVIFDTRSIVLSKIPSRLDIFGQCRRCHRGVVATTSTYHEHGNIIPQLDDMELLSSYSNILELEHVPLSIAGKFMEGFENIQDRRYFSAGMVFRKALEMAMNIKFPQIKARNLAEKIAKAADEKLLTEEMKELAKGIKDIGNDAAHEDTFTQEDAEYMQRYTHLLLVYMFTLPGMVEEIRGEVQDDQPQ